jgi:hypothetical protein
MKHSLLACGVAVSLLAATACSGSGNGSHDSGAYVSAPLAPTPTSASYLAQIRERDQQTIAYADRLAAHAPRIAGETPFTGTPPKDLRGPDETIGVGNLVTHARYWTVPGTPDAVYRALEKTYAAGLRLTGHGLPSSRAEEPAGQGFLHWDPTHSPSYIADVELYVEMEQLSPGRVIVAAFGEAAAHPVRVAAETIPVAASHVVVTKTRHTLKAAVHSARTISFTPAASRALTAAFNASPTHPPVACVGGIGPSWSFRIIIRSAGHTWKVQYPGSSCFGLSVVRDDLSLTDLEPTVEFQRILRLAFLVDRGLIHGHLLAVGGPAGSRPAHIYGHLTLTRHGQVVVHRRTDGAGAFSFSAPSGTYTLRGGSAYAKVDGHHDRCVAPDAVVVRPNRATETNIYCQFR